MTSKETSVVPSKEDLLTYGIAHAILAATVYKEDDMEVCVSQFICDGIETHDVDMIFVKDYKEYGGEAMFEIACRAAEAAIVKYRELQNAEN